MYRTFATPLSFLFIFLLAFAMPALALELWNWQVDNPNKDGDAATVQIVDTTKSNTYQVDMTSVKIADNPSVNPKDIVVRLVYVDGSGVTKNPRLYLSQPIIIETTSASIVAENGGHLHAQGRLKLLNH